MKVLSIVGILEGNEIGLPLQITPLASTAAGKKDAMYRMDVEGIIPPWCLTRICHALSRMEGSDYKVSANSSESNLIHASFAQHRYVRLKTRLWHHNRIMKAEI